MNISIQEYNSIHHWARKTLDKIDECFYCGSPYTEWSNIDHQYRMDVTEWQEVCQKCHTQFDILMNDKRVFGVKKKMVGVPRNSAGHPYWTKADRMARKRIESYPWFRGWYE